MQAERLIWFVFQTHQIFMIYKSFQRWVLILKILCYVRQMNALRDTFWWVSNLISLAVPLHCRELVYIQKKRNKNLRMWEEAVTYNICLLSVNTEKSLKAKISCLFCILQFGVNEFWESAGMERTQQRPSLLVVLCGEIKICSTIIDNRRRLSLLDSCVKTRMICDIMSHDVKMLCLDVCNCLVRCYMIHWDRRLKWYQIIYQCYRFLNKYD